MEKLRHRITLLVCFGTLLFLGPFLSNASLADNTIAHIPLSYLFIFLVWLLLIVLTGWMLHKSDW